MRTIDTHDEGGSMEWYRTLSFWGGRAIHVAGIPVRWTLQVLVIVFATLYHRIIDACVHDFRILGWEPLSRYIWDRSASTRTVRNKSCRVCGVARSRPIHGVPL